MANSNEYMREYMLKRYHARRANAIEMLGGVCAQCGDIEDLELDHIDPYDKSFSISKMWSVSHANFMRELGKCQLLCNYCHKKKSSEEASVEHGGGVSGKRNCSCDLCKARKADYMKSYVRTGR